LEYKHASNYVAQKLLTSAGAAPMPAVCCCLSHCVADLFIFQYFKVLGNWTLGELKSIKAQSGQQDAGEDVCCL
jgi:hypothetical protein